MSQLKRYSRTEAVLGAEAVEKLNKCTVLIAGLGGVGGYCLEALVRSGVKHFVLADFDKFDETNLNRQILCLEDNIGKLKTDAAMLHLKEIDSTVSVVKLDMFIDSSNIDVLFAQNPDLVVDAIDSVNSKCLLLSECVKRGIPVVSSMGAAMKKDVSMLKIADLSKTYGCPLAKCVRTEMKKYGIEQGIDCVFSPEKTDTDKSKKGSLATVVGAFGFALAQTALEKIYNKN